MLRYLFLFLLSIHGLIHLLGFVKTFQINEVEQLTQPISRPVGLLWLVTTLLFLVTAGLYLSGNGSWSVLAFLSIVLSQILIFMTWQDAKFGTIANVIILLVAIAGYGSWSFEKRYRADVQEGLERTTPIETEQITEEDLAPLPAPVQRYLRYAGAVGKPKVKNVKITFSGRMRDKGQDWFVFSSEQYNFFDEKPERLFFMRAKVKGLPAAGYHAYQDGQAEMKVKLLSLFPVVDIQGEEMFQAETVTLFNDMCLMAPSTLIDERIQWQAIDDTSARAIFTNRGVSISATLYFNEEGQLVDFVSDDRYAVSDMKKYRFSTPVSNYKDFNGYRLLSSSEAVWHYPDGKFAYGEIDLQSVEYNLLK